MTATAYPLPRETRETAALVSTGAAVLGPFGFRAFDPLDIVLYSRANAMAAWVEHPLYVVNKQADLPLDIFTITATPIVPNGHQYMVRSERLHERQSGITRGGRLDTAALDIELSRQSSVLQENRRDIDRAAKAPFGVRGPTFPASDVGKTIVYDANGDFTLGPDAATIAAAETFAVRAEAAAAQAAQTQGNQPFRSRTVTLLQADTALAYAPAAVGKTPVTPGMLVLGGPYMYDVAAAAATDQAISTGGGVKLYAEPSVRGLHVRQFGAKGQAGVDDLAAIRRTAEACRLQNAPMIFDFGIYEISGTVDLGGVSTAHCDDAVFKPTFVAGPALRWSPDNLFYSPGVPRLRIDRPVASGKWRVFWRSGLAPDWTVDSVSYLVENCYDGRFEGFSSFQAGRGLVLNSKPVAGEGTGCVYNTFELGDFWQNCVGNYLASSFASSWVNDNTFNRGHFYGYHPTTGAIYAADAAAIRVKTIAYVCNGNKWNDTALELVTPNVNGHLLYKLDGFRNTVKPQYCEVEALSTVTGLPLPQNYPWAKDGGAQNVHDVYNVPSDMGYDEALGAANRIDISTAIEPTIMARRSYYYLGASGKQVYINNSATNAPLDLRNENALGPDLRVRSGLIDFSTNNSQHFAYRSLAFTPTLVGGTVPGVATFDNLVGEYVLLGKACFIKIHMTWSAHTGSGAMIIGGLPFITRNNSQFRQTLDVLDQNIASIPAGSRLIVSILPGVNTFNVSSKPTSGVGRSTFPLPTSGEITISGFYIINGEPT